MENKSKSVVVLNVGGKEYSTTIETLTKEKHSALCLYFSNPTANNPTLSILPTGENSYFIDRDGILFRFVLDYLRSGKLVLPDHFNEQVRLREEAKVYKLTELVKSLRVSTATETDSPTKSTHTSELRINTFEKSGAGYITVGYRGTFAFGRDGQADVKFRKLSRILVCGRVGLCREIFGDTLNESRDPDRGGDDRYTSRLFLKHNSLEQTFDTLSALGFSMITCCASSASGGASMDAQRNIQNTVDTEEQKWAHYNEFVFYRPPLC